MAGLADFHTVAALQRGVQLYLDSATAFKALFPNIEDSVLSVWHNALVVDPPEILVYGQKSKKEFPVIVVAAPDESPDNEAPLNNFAYQDDAGHDHVQEITVENLTIEILTREIDTTRALTLVVRAAMLQALQWFLDAGYLSTAFNGNDPISPEEDLAAEAMGITVRRLRYSVKSTLDVKILEAPPVSKPWFVGAADETFDGHSGGVVTYEP